MMRNWNRRTRKSEAWTREGQAFYDYLDEHEWTLEMFATMHGTYATYLSAWATGQKNISTKWIVAKLPKELAKEILFVRAQELADLAESL